MSDVKEPIEPEEETPQQGAEETPVEPDVIDAVVEEAAEVVASDIASIAAERDEYLDSLQRLQADFQNYKRRVGEQQQAASDRGAESLVIELLPVLDALDLALAHGETGVEAVGTSLIDVLRKAGLDRVDPVGSPFDPTEHDAVLHEDGDGPAEVIEVMRPGYRWKGRLLRPAMVKVKGS